MFVYVIASRKIKLHSHISVLHHIYDVIPCLDAKWRRLDFTQWIMMAFTKYLCISIKHNHGIIMGFIKLLLWAQQNKWIFIGTIDWFQMHWNNSITSLGSILLHIISDDWLMKEIELILWKLSSIPMKILNDVACNLNSNFYI